MVENPGAGAFLKPLLAPGNALDADGLARALGDPGVSPDAFVAAIVPRLSGTGAEGQSPAPSAPASPPPGPTSAAEPAGAAAKVAPPGMAPDAGATERSGTR